MRTGTGSGGGRRGRAGCDEGGNEGDLGVRRAPWRSGGRHRDDPDQAQVEQRIFSLFVAGSSPVASAKTLNREGIPDPGGKAWQDTRSVAMPVAVLGSCATSSISAGWSGIACASSATR
ncbi:recombinase family protein [Lichenicoccus roseus]|uniref:Recombinase domain-containing protein n=1 Tax=Lichenicoccus roseus TaxID=2683649 RepID=A0A5R9IZ05_9PROT|nr:hypothetical protein FE263_20300 [Lichenicoccus roseus]